MTRMEVGGAIGQIFEFMGPLPIFSRLPYALPLEYYVV